VLIGIAPPIPIGGLHFSVVTLTIDRVSPHFIELTDPHGDIIRLTR